MRNVLEQISDLGVLPVIKIEKLEQAVPLANALRQGGVNAIEVIVRNEIAFDAIDNIRSSFPDMLIGAGTILTAQLADQAMEAGARYIVTPGYNPQVVRHCLDRGIPIVPGCVTPSEIQTAIDAGLQTLKFFPAGPQGATAAIKLLSGPFPKVRFIPTGGIDFSNMTEYARLECVAAVGGSFMAKADLIQNENWEEIAANCRKAISMSLGFELAHVGINHERVEEAMDSAERMDGFLALGIRCGNSSIFCGKAVECMKTKYYGEKGHIGFYTNSVQRARAWFLAKGIPIREDSIRKDGNGKWVSFYLKEEVSGFAVHVVKR